MPSILIDTNILVYSCDPSEFPRQDRALEILENTAILQAGCVSVQNLAEFMNVTTRSLNPILTPQEALNQVKRLIQSFRVYDLTSAVVMEAGRAKRDFKLAYYDAQIWATAKLNQIPIVFSEDFNHGQVLEGVRFVNPFVKAFVLEDWL